MTRSGMNNLIKGPPRPVSAWMLDSEREVFREVLREVEVVAEPLENLSGLLRDPPVQFEDGFADASKDEKKNASEELKDLRKQVGEFCSSQRRPELPIRRKAPSIYAEQQDVNTIEIVKKDGLYSVVIDGVSEGVIRKTRNGFEEANYWIPRFKERYAKSKKNPKRLVRTTQPVVFAMRLEDFEAPPELCEIKTLQRVVCDGTVVMENTVVKTETLNPYSTGSAASDVVVLPYPIISTPEPHFHVNDYSRMRHAEVAVKVSEDGDVLKYTRQLLQRVSGFIPGSSQARLTWRDYKNWAKAVQDAALKIVGSGVAAAAGGAAVASGTAAVTQVAEAASASALASAGVSLAPAALGGGLAGLGVFMAWEMLSSSRNLVKWTVTKDDIERLKAMHENECVKEVEQHRIGITELPKILRRISETRSNGSMVNGTEQTIGLSVHDLEDIDWRREAAFLHWLQYGEGDRFYQTSVAAKEVSRLAAVAGVAATVYSMGGLSTLAGVASAASAAAKSVAWSLAPAAAEVIASSWLSYSAQWKLDQWISTLTSYEPPNPITGRYNLQQNIQHNNDLRYRSTITPLTGNTISRAGLDSLTLSNTRTQISFLIEIVERDGTRGPSIHIEATRMNGIDAAWVSSGYDEVIEDIRREIDCLEFKLMSMPSVTSWMSTHSTLVADTNNGQIVGDKFDMQVNQAMGQHLGDTQPVTTEEDIRNMKKKEDAREKKALKDLVNARKTLAEANKGVALVENDKKKTRESYENKVNQINNTPGLTPAQIADRIDRARQSRDNRLEMLDKRLLKKQNVARDKDDEARRKARIKGAWAIRSKAATTERKFANIIDYAAVVNRLRVQLIGDEYDIFAPADAERKIETDRAERVQQKSFWSRVAQNFKRLPVVEAQFQHQQRCLEALNASLSLPSGSIDAKSVLYLRFTDIFSPVSPRRDPQRLRLAAFAVPRINLWLTPKSRPDYMLVRMLPQIVLFSASITSSFGNTKILQLQNVSGSDVADRSLKGLNASVKTADVAITRISNLYDMQRLLIWKDVCHTIQLYKQKQNWASEMKNVFTHTLDTNLSPVDFMAMAALQTKAVSRSESVAVDAGGDNMQRMMQIAAGREAGGAAKLLKSLGCQLNHSGVLAVATFSEILAFHVLEHGASETVREGLGLQYQEIVSSVREKARRVAATVANFIVTYYANSGRRPRRMVYRDVAFYCLEGMSYVRVALRRIGLLEDTQRKNQIFVEWTTSDKQFAKDFAMSLSKIASSTNADPALFPFTCAQSVVGGIPQVVKSYAEYTEPATAQVASLVHAFKRVRITTEAVGAEVNERAMLCLRADCVCSRPIALKLAKLYPTEMAEIIGRVESSTSQAAWKRPRPSMSGAFLRHRLARLRLDVDHAILASNVKTPRSSKTTQDAIYQDLVKSVTALTVKGLAVNRLPERATFMVPFGTYDVGSAADIVHMNFEMRPVWLEDLMGTAMRMRNEASVPWTHEVQLKLRLEGPSVDGRPRHPYTIEAASSYVSIYAEDTDSLKTVQVTAVPPASPKQTNTLQKTLEVVNSDPYVGELTGELSEVYRSTMHSAERVFQACLVLASGAYHLPLPASGIVAQVDLRTRVDPAKLVVAACIGNALASTATGAPVQIVASTPSQTPEQNARMATAAAAIVRACKMLMSEKVVAMPFYEACCCFSCL